MELDIVWSKKAIDGYAQILKYIDENWSQKEVSKFEKQVNNFLLHLSKFPYILQNAPLKDIRRGPINKLTVLTY